MFEAGLGSVLVVGAVSGALDGSDFPSPVGPAVLVAVGTFLLVLAYVIWNGRIGVVALATGNAATAVAGLIWLVAGSGFSPAGAVIVALTVAILAVLAVVQVVTLRT